jgi:ABC-type polysaccharide/polyol phosphate export permease
MRVTELWKFRWLFLNLLIREVRNRYIGSLSGIFSIIFNPLALLAVYAFVFAVILRVKFPMLVGHNFTVFLALGLWPWLAFQEGAQQGMLSVQSSGSLVKKVAFPHELLVYSTVTAAYIVQLGGFSFVLLALVIFGSNINLSALPLVICILAAQYLFTLGLALALAALQVLIKDTRQYISTVFMIWFYATPVLYPISLVPESMRQAVMLNPMTYFTGRIRDFLLYGNYQFGLLDVAGITGTVLFFLLARLFFKRLSPHFEDFL